MTKMERRWSALWSPAVRGSLFIAVGFMLLAPATGINAVVYYGPQIFTLAGISSNKSAIFATLVVAITNVLATVIGLLLVDRAGRKPLLYVGRRRHDGRALGAFSLLSQPGSAGVVAGHHRHRLPDVLHHLLRLQHGADRVDHCLGSISVCGCAAAALLPPR